MAEQIKQVEKEYTIPLRREWQKVARYKRSRRGIKTIKKYIAKHMRVPERDEDKVKLDIYLNNEIWARGAKKPPAKIKVKAVKKGDIIEVTLVHEKAFVAFAKKRHDKRHSKPVKKKEEKPKEKEKEKKLEDKVTEQDKKEETEEKKDTDKEKDKTVKEIHKKVSSAPKEHQKMKVPKSQHLIRKTLKK